MASHPEPLQPYQPIREIARDLYCVDGEWYKTAFRRRMTVVRLLDRSLVIHSAIRMEERDMAALDDLGRVGTIVVPNVFHDSEAPFYAERYPEAKVYVPEKIREKAAARMRVSGVLERDWEKDPILSAELPCVSFRDTLAAESVFGHLASRTLIMTDMAFNIASGDFKNPIERLVFGEWNGIVDRFGPSRLTKLLAARSRASVKEALEKLAALDFERVIMSHGRIVAADGKRQLLEGYARVYGKL